MAYNLLDAPLSVSFDGLTRDISLRVRSSVRKYLQVDQHIKYSLDVPIELDHPSESDILNFIRRQTTVPEQHITRLDLSRAFDAISELEKTQVWTAVPLECSSFDRTISIITEDLAPYVRSIVAYDARLQQERAKLSNLMSQGGRKGKRMRTTRAAMSALEGGTRNTTRRDKYFSNSDLNPYLVMRTGVKAWQDAVLTGDETEGRDPDGDEDGSNSTRMSLGTKNDGGSETNESVGYNSSTEF